MNKNRVPLIITMDLEIADDHDINDQSYILNRLNNDLQKINLPITIFSTTKALETFKEEILNFNNTFHEIANHGFAHTPDENFRKMDAKEIQKKISAAVNTHKNILGNNPLSFRGPRMTTSASTHKILSEFGFHSDYSVCSQRMDFFNSGGSYAGWIIAPRKPYRANLNSPYRKGNSEIVVVPLSSIVIPFISGTLYLLKLEAMKRFFRILLAEAKGTTKPIVYLFHSYEFCSYSNSGKEKSRQKFIQRLYIQDREARYLMNFELFKYMLSFDSVTPITAEDYYRQFISESIKSSV